MKRWQALAYFLLIGGAMLALREVGPMGALSFGVGFGASVVNLWGLERATNLIASQWANRELTPQQRMMTNMAILLKFPVAIGGFFLVRPLDPQAGPWFLGGFLLVYLPLIGRAQDW
jgi:hypothetical protein